MEFESKDRGRVGNAASITLRFSVCLLVGLFFAGLWASPSVAEDNDYPHNYVQGASCNTGTCHTAYGGGAGPDVSEGDIACLYCHDDIDPVGSLPAPTVATHSSDTTSAKYGTWATKCIDCHHEHLQMQYWAYGEESFVFTGFSDPGGITETTLTMTGAGWEEDCFAGMVLFPNIDDPYADYSNYGIIGNTADTITVKGPMLLDGGSWDTPIGTGNKNFAVVYGQGINSNVPDETPTRPVRFFRPEGANSFADGDSTYDGICEVCHTKTNHHRNDGSAPLQSHYDGARCTSCHSHENGFKPDVFDHNAAGAVLPDPTCMECHGTQGADPVADVHGNSCGLCHFNTFGGGPLVEPLESTVPHGGDCTACHEFSKAHGNVAHTASPGSGSVVIFPDDSHDDAGWSGDPPYFDVSVDCDLCHANDLRKVHSNDCATCHPSPYDSLGIWNGGCQQGGCHSEFHEDVLTAHQPFAVINESVNDCTRCHDPSSWDVPQANCLNCHAASGAGAVTPPVTTSNVQPEYDGRAEIAFTIWENGKVGVGRTFYRLDGSTVTAAGKTLTVTEPGSHSLEFWSVDQSGNTETSSNQVSFTIYEDTIPPTTTSNARSSYYQGGIITLSATDDSTLGVQDTFYSLNDGPAQTGTTVILPTTPGTIPYTLDFWSVDWSGNVETKKSVAFTVSSGPGTIRLVWWDCDLYPSHAPFGSDKANWTIHRDSRWGAVVASGSGASPGWNGINDVAIPVGSQKYFVRVYWWDSYEGYYEITDFPNVSVTTPGQVVRLSY